MKRLISLSIIIFCFVLVCDHLAGQTNTKTTQQKKVPPKTQTTQTKKAPAKTPAKAPATTQKSTVKKPAPVPNKSEAPAVPCAWQKNESDPFSASKARMTNWEVVGFISSVNTAVNNGLTGDYKFSISQNIQNKDTTWNLWIKTSTSQNLTFNKDSKLMIKSGETILTINLIGAQVTGRNITSNGILDKDTRKFLKKHPLDLVRIQFTGDGNAIVNVDLKEVNTTAKLVSDYFMRTLRCFD